MFAVGKRSEQRRVQRRVKAGRKIYTQREAEADVDTEGEPEGGRRRGEEERAGDREKGGGGGQCLFSGPVKKPEGQ